jgi:hypothetical protein
MPSSAKATVASSDVLNSTMAYPLSLDVKADRHGSVAEMTLRPLSCKLKNSTRPASVTAAGALYTNTRFDCRACDGLRADELACAPGWLRNACSRVVSSAAWRGAPGSGNMPDSFACSAVTLSYPGGLRSHCVSRRLRSRTDTTSVRSGVGSLRFAGGLPLRRRSLPPPRGAPPPRRRSSWSPPRGRLSSSPPPRRSRRPPRSRSRSHPPPGPLGPLGAPRDSSGRRWSRA